MFLCDGTHKLLHILYLNIDQNIERKVVRSFTKMYFFMQVTEPLLQNGPNAEIWNSSKMRYLQTIYLSIVYIFIPIFASKFFVNLYIYIMAEFILRNNYKVCKINGWNWLNLLSLKSAANINWKKWIFKDKTGSLWRENFEINF